VGGYDSFVLVSFGGPERAEDVMPFLRRVTAGKGIPAERIAEVASHYYEAGGSSPLNTQCRDLLSALATEMAELSLKLYWGNRNWHPLLEDTVAQMRDDGVTRAVAFVTSAYGGYSSCRQYLDDIATARARVGPRAPEIDKLRLFFDHPGWVGAWAASLADALRQCSTTGSAEPAAKADQPQIVFSAHSIPVAYAETSPYVQHVAETARLVAGAAGVGSWQLAWQSRSGRPSAPWLGPDVCETIEASVATTTVVVPIGFVCDNMEVTHDLDVEAADAARRAGTHLVRARGVSTSPAFVRMVRQLVQERLTPAPVRRALGNLGPWPDHCPQGHCAAPPQCSAPPQPGGPM